MSSNRVSYHKETLIDAKKFSDELEELGKIVDLKKIRLYILTGEKDPNISDSIYQKADEIFAIRKKAIAREMCHGRAQAKLAGIIDQIPEDVLDGSSLNIIFEEEEFVPSLEVYKYFIPYTKQEAIEARKEKEKRSKNGSGNTDEKNWFDRFDE